MSITRSQVEEARSYIKADADKVRAGINRALITKANALMQATITADAELSKLLAERETLNAQAAQITEALEKCNTRIAFYEDAIEGDEATDEEARQRTDRNQDIENVLRGQPHFRFKHYGFGNPGNRLTKAVFSEVSGWPEWDTLAKIDQLQEYLDRKATFCKTEDELAMLYAEFYRYDWRSAGLAIPPSLPEFISVGGHVLKLLDYVPKEDGPQ